MTKNELLHDYHFADEPVTGGGARVLAPWKMLIVDDEKDVHDITVLALRDFHHEGRELHYFHAYRGAEAVEIMRAHPDIAVILMDVVMEGESDGLDAINRIRKELGNHMVRIVLRTGQPGQAPEREVITRYDINDYKEKSELTRSKLYTSVYTNLKHYNDLQKIEAHRQEIAQVLAATVRIFEKTDPYELAQAVLEEMYHLVSGIEHGAATVECHGIAACGVGGSAPPLTLAGLGRHVTIPGSVLEDARLRAEVEALQGQTCSVGEDYCAFSLVTHNNIGTVFYLSGLPTVRQSAGQIMDLFCHNVRIALENTRLNQEIRKTEHELVYMLSEAIEKRSRETGNHVRRVAEYSQLLGRLSGLSEPESRVLLVAAPLHDAGKIAIPDAILNKPGRHTEDETVIMRTHAEIGGRMFEGHELPVFHAAAIIANEHHERWDGKGYPRGLVGEQAHIYGRITALADVFDALGSARCYKSAWPLDKTLKLLTEERGKQFDPRLIDLFLGNLGAFLEIRDRLQDAQEEPAAAT